MPCQKPIIKLMPDYSQPASLYQATVWNIPLWKFVFGEYPNSPTAFWLESGLGWIKKLNREGLRGASFLKRENVFPRSQAAHLAGKSGMVKRGIFFSAAEAIVSTMILTVSTSGPAR